MFPFNPPNSDARGLQDSLQLTASRRNVFDSGEKLKVFVLCSFLGLEPLVRESFESDVLPVEPANTPSVVLAVLPVEPPRHPKCGVGWLAV